MDNKLSELSKPVFEIEVSGGHWLNCTSGKLTPDAGADFSDWPDGVNRLYSQEYVFALLVRITWLESISTDYISKFQKAQERIAELEAKLSEMTTFRDNAVKKNKQRWEELLELRAKLATPVRSPDDGLEDCQKMFPLNCDNDFNTGYNFGLYRYEQNIRAAGFKVEGDE